MSNPLYLPTSVYIEGMEIMIPATKMDRSALLRTQGETISRLKAENAELRAALSAIEVRAGMVRTGPKLILAAILDIQGKARAALSGTSAKGADHV